MFSTCVPLLIHFLGGAAAEPPAERGACFFSVSSGSASVVVIGRGHDMAVSRLGFCSSVCSSVHVDGRGRCRIFFVPVCAVHVPLITTFADAFALSGACFGRKVAMMGI